MQTKLFVDGAWGDPVRGGTFTEAPWGGYKRNGISRELGRWGLDNYLQVKQITRYTTDQPWGRSIT